MSTGQSVMAIQRRWSYQRCSKFAACTMRVNGGEDEAENRNHYRRHRQHLLPYSGDQPRQERGPGPEPFAAWNSHDADKVASFYTDDVVYEDVAFGLKANGQVQMRKLAADFFAGIPDLKLEVVSNTSRGDRGSVEWVFSGTDVGLYKTGKKFSVRGASVYELRGGKFSSNRDYYDAASIMRQVGILPAAPQ
jgi:steroid delta-isomerase-like uncharacterized protein